MNLVYYPHPVLLKKTKAVETPFDESLPEKVDRMFEIMDEHQGVGLAAPQVGWGTRLFVMSPTGEKADRRVIINPRIVKKWGKEVGQEGCLSLPKIYVEVNRAVGLELSFSDLSGEEKTETFEGFPARVIQHENDHLEGILLIHKMSLADKLVHRRALKDLEAGSP